MFSNYVISSSVVGATTYLQSISCESGRQGLSSGLEQMVTFQPMQPGEEQLGTTFKDVRLYARLDAKSQILGSIDEDYV